LNYRLRKNSFSLLCKSGKIKEGERNRTIWLPIYDAISNIKKAK
jgi:hypothetical protein